MFNWVGSSVTILVKPIAERSKTGIELSLSITACKAAKVGSDVLSSDRITHKAV
ncbi:hypothetical protein ACFLTJ_02880 [Chloroflexota bacterium]